MAQDPLVVDPALPAVLTLPGREPLRCVSTTEARAAWAALAAEDRAVATITVRRHVYAAAEIARFAFGPGPDPESDSP